MKIVFFGSSRFSDIILEKLSKSEFCPSLVVSTKNNFLKTDLPINIYPCQIEGADLFIVASFGKILRKQFLDIPEQGSLNVHPSLLPKYRGPSPIQQTILNNDQKTGSTIILMDELVDHGKIVAQKEYFITEKETFLSLEEKLANFSAELLIKAISDWLNNKKAREQKEAEASYTRIFQKQDGRINWQEPVEMIERKIRAFYSWPGTFTFWKKNDKILRIKILQGKVGRKNFSPIPGKVDKNLSIQCKQGVLLVEKLQLEGKKPIKAEDFLKGYPQIYESILF